MAANCVAPCFAQDVGAQIFAVDAEFEGKFVPQPRGINQRAAADDARGGKAGEPDGVVGQHVHGIGDHDEDGVGRKFGEGRQELAHEPDVAGAEHGAVGHDLRHRHGGAHDDDVGTGGVVHGTGVDARGDFDEGLGVAEVKGRRRWRPRGCGRRGSFRRRNFAATKRMRAWNRPSPGRRPKSSCARKSPERGRTARYFNLPRRPADGFLSARGRLETFPHPRRQQTKRDEQGFSIPVFGFHPPHPALSPLPPISIAPAQPSPGRDRR